MRAAAVAQVPGDVHAINGRERAEVVADPLAITVRRPAGGEVVVQCVLRDVAVIPARDDRGHGERGEGRALDGQDRKSTRLNSSHLVISYAVFCLNKKKTRLISRQRAISYAVLWLTTESCSAGSPPDAPSSCGSARA